MVSVKTIEKGRLASGISQRQTLKFVQFLRKDVKVEPNLKTHLAKLNIIHQDLFDIIEDTTLQKDDSIPVIYCKNVTALADRILDDRKLSHQDVFLRVSIDEGQSFLKVSASLVIKNPAKEQKDDYKSTGVKRTFLLAISPVQEKYNSVAVLLSLIKLEDISPQYQVVFTQDLKCFNLVMGIGAHSSKHPCLFCD
jgi:hypothetical protein